MSRSPQRGPLWTFTREGPNQACPASPRAHDTCHASILKMSVLKLVSFDTAEKSSAGFESSQANFIHIVPNHNTDTQQV